MIDSKIETDPIILMCAFRYSLGRATYIVGWVADELIRHRDVLRPQWRQQTVRDIREAIGEDRAGMDVDSRRWLDVVTAFHAVPTACRGCALTEDVCVTFPPLCCQDCDHTPASAVAPPVPDDQHAARRAAVLLIAAELDRDAPARPSAPDLAARLRAAVGES